MKKLVAYYSRADENYINGELRMLEMGNTQVAAEYIAKLEYADLFCIEQAKPYSRGYNDCIAEAQADQRADKRPEITSYLASIDEYDEIYLGYPNYWGTMPMAVFTFLEHYDFSGKIIKPFCTHEGSRMGRSESDIKRLCPNAEVKAGLPIHGAAVKESLGNIKNWIDETI